MSSKTKAITESHAKLDFMKTEALCKSRMCPGHNTAPSQGKRQFSNWRRALSVQMTDNGLMCKMYKDNIHMNNKIKYQA